MKYNYGDGEQINSWWVLGMGVSEYGCELL